MAEEREPRPLGVIECFHAVLNQCPSGAVRTAAEHGLAVVEREGAGALPQQAYLLLVATRGWQGQRAAQVRRSLEAYLAEAGSSG